MVSFKTGASFQMLFRLAVFLVAALALYGSYTLSFQRLEGLLPDLAGRLLPEVEQSGAVAVIAIDTSIFVRFIRSPGVKNLA